MKLDLMLLFCTIIFLSFTIKGSVSVQQNGTHYRGTMISTHLKADDFRVLASWKANHVRWQLNWESGEASKANVSQYIAWLESALTEFDAMVPVLRDLGLHILLDLHTPPGGRDDQQRYRIFTEQQFQDCFLTVWKMMANRYKNETQIMGYDILNEPDDRILAPSVLNWRNLSILAIQNIRAIDPQRPIVFEASPGALPNTLPTFVPLPFDNIIYSIHMYEPYEFTFQNLNNNVTPIYYPGKIGDKMFNKDQLRAILQPNVDWQKAHNVPIHIGEFSAIRWAPGNSTANYLSDLIDLYEEYGWTWGYHAFREFQGWDVEMIGDKDHPQRSPVPTDRQLVLMNGLRKNEQ